MTDIGIECELVTISKVLMEISASLKQIADAIDRCYDEAIPIVIIKDE